MALNTSQYTDPGAYIGEVLVPGAINIAGQPFTVCLLGIGSTERSATNEAVVRGLKTGVALTGFTLVNGWYRATALTERSDRRLENTTVYKDTVALSDSYVRYVAASVTGNALGATVNLDGGSFALSLDGKVAITIEFYTGGGASVATRSGAFIRYNVSNDTATTRAAVAAGINAALTAHPSYTATYGSAASIDGSNKLVITGTSAVHIFNILGENGATTIMGATDTVAASQIEIETSQYNASSTYTLDYVSTEDTADGFVQTANIQAITAVGDFAGVTNYTEGGNTGYSLSGQTISWADTNWTSAAQTGDEFNAPAAGATDELKLSIDNKSTLTIDTVDAGVTGMPGWTATPSTRAHIAANINRAFIASDNYGADYSTVATDTGTFIKLTSPTKGETGAVRIEASNGLLRMLGTIVANTATVGTGKAPAAGSTYFTSYAYTRPGDGYASEGTGLVTRHTSLDSALDEVGSHAVVLNEMAMAAQVAFDNGANAILIGLVKSVNNLSVALKTVSEFDAATEICLVGSIGIDDTAINALKNHLETTNGPFFKRYRRAWVGLAAGAQPGSKNETEDDSIIYAAARKLQVTANSAARGRMIVMAPPQVDALAKTVQLPDGTFKQFTSLDSTYLAVAAAAFQTSFASPSSTLVRQSLNGFDVDAITQPFTTQERHDMASMGVTVVTLDAGSMKLLDPITTERAGGAMISFEQIQASLQKDNVTRKMTQALDANLVGIVPADLASFVTDIKSVIAAVLTAEINAGAIGPFQTSTGSERPVSFVDDMEVIQSPTDPTKFNFKYFYNLRYPALRLFGEYSVDNPFFG